MLLSLREASFAQGTGLSILPLLFYFRRQQADGNTFSTGHLGLCLQSQQTLYYMTQKDISD